MVSEILCPALEDDSSKFEDILDKAAQEDTTDIETIKNTSKRIIQEYAACTNSSINEMDELKRKQFKLFWNKTDCIPYFPMHSVGSVHLYARRCIRQLKKESPKPLQLVTEDRSLKDFNLSVQVINYYNRPTNEHKSISDILKNVRLRKHLLEENYISQLTKYFVKDQWLISLILFIQKAEIECKCRINQTKLRFSQEMLLEMRRQHGMLKKF